MSHSFSNGLRPPISVWKLGVIVSIIVGIEAMMVADEISESSVTEFGQEALLLSAGILSGFVAWKFPAIRMLMVLFTGLLGCMFIRELDALLDNVFHGFWLYPAILCAVGAILYAMRCPRISLRESWNWVMSPSFRLLNVGLLTVLVISRVVGTGRLWSLLTDNSHAAQFYKNAVQEGVELWGYALVATGMWCVLLRFKSSEESDGEGRAMPEIQNSNAFGDMARGQHKQAA